MVVSQKLKKWSIALVNKNPCMDLSITEGGR